MIIKSFDGTKISYKLKKKSNLFLVFIHGWVNDWTTWKKEIEFFQRKGYSTLTLDLRGHGQSDKPEGKNKYRLEYFARDIQVIIKKEEIKYFILVGHSMGGIISLMYYKMFNKHEEIKGLILCDTTYRNILVHRTIKHILPFVRYILDFIISHETINKKYFSHLKDIDLNKYNNCSDYFVFYRGLYNAPLKSVFACLEAMLNFNLKNVLPTIKVPVLIIEGAQDKLLPKIDSLELYEEIKDAEIDFVPKGKHFVNIQNPKLVSKYIFNFLSKHGLTPRIKIIK